MKKLFSMRMQCWVLVAASTILTSCASDAERTNSAENLLATNTVIATTAVTNAPATPIVRIEPAKVTTSPGLQEIIQLCQADVDESVVLAYIERSPIAYDPSVEEILYLNDIGISPQVVAALLKHSRELTAQAAEKASKTQPPATPVMEDPIAISTSTTNTIVTTVPGTPTVQYVQSGPPVVPETQVVTRTETVVPPQQQVTVNYFYSSLSPYGTWMQVDDYGWCWQPTVVNTYSNWQPYCDRGRWLYTDCGWYWQSDYTWGWAPFHYGRWFRHGGYGWVWCPDTEWGSAWVSWRNSPGYCGWAPLPPRANYDGIHGWAYRGRHVGIGFDFGLSFDCFTFVALGHFYDHNPYGHFVDRDHRRTLYTESTIDNRYHRGSDGRVFNDGIGRDRISAVTHSEIRQVSVRDTPASSAHAIRPDRTERNGKDVVIYRPSPQQPPTALPGATGKRPDNNRPPVSITDTGASRATTSPRQAEAQIGSTKSSLGKTPTPPATTSPRIVESPSFGHREATPSGPSPVVGPTPASTPKAVENRKLFSERSSSPQTIAPVNTAPATSVKSIDNRAEPSSRMPVTNTRTPAWTAPASAPTLSAPMPTVRSQTSPTYLKPAEAVRSVDSFKSSRTPMTAPTPNPSQGIHVNPVTTQYMPSTSPIPANRSLSSPPVQRMEAAPIRQMQQAPVRMSSPSFSAPPRATSSSPSISASPSPRPAAAPSSSSSSPRGNQSNTKRP